jgi:histidinol-phosphate/aromatic aminotransferase/cobyric acid decarboxylase-like protein
MSVFAQDLGIACSRACGETDHIVESKRIIKEEREYLSDGLKDLGFKVFDSDTNFILIKAEEDLYDRLLSKGILIRDCSNFDGLSKGYFRLAVRGHFDNERLLQIIKKL